MLRSRRLKTIRFVPPPDAHNFEGTPPACVRCGVGGTWDEFRNTWLIPIGTKCPGKVAPVASVS